jgi:hypothetical protein
MLINIDLLEGATLEYNGCFYTAHVNDKRLQICETFTGLAAPDSDTEKEVLKAMISEVAKMDPRQ